MTNRPTTLRIPADLKRELKDQALREGRTVASLMLFLMREGLKRQKALFSRTDRKSREQQETAGAGLFD